MASRRALGCGVLAVIAGLALPNWAGAGPLACDNPECQHDVKTYSRWHFWAPTLYRIHERFHEPAPCFDTPDRHPDVPPRFVIFNYPCRWATPSRMAADRQTAP